MPGATYSSSSALGAGFPLPVNFASLVDFVVTGLVRSSILADSMDDLRDSVHTSVRVKVFPSTKKSLHAHVFESELVHFPLSKCKDLSNFNPARLSKNPYPREDRPRGQADIDSVAYHIKTIRREGEADPIYIAVKDEDYTLLDGAHRIVATYLEKKRTIPAYLVNAS